ncbi:S41 family peptidase [Hymenobacter terrenus]|uniref:S41 family peptidase n=1 Tax=Hymenobacter terrenus TaxID=1629124 RepID=UPI0006193F50|nr:S41 family peptidase [Hymenobacter terrenus]
MKKALIFLLTVLLSCNLAKAQTPPPTLTQAQRYQDYDYLVSTIRSLNAQIEVRKKVTGLDIVGELKALRKHVATCKSDADFYFLLREAIDLCNDEHSNLLWKQFLTRPLKYLVPYSITPLDSMQVQESVLANDIAVKGYLSKYARQKLRLPLKYFNGKYLVYEDFTYKGQLIKRGAQVEKVDGMDVHQFVQTKAKYLGKKWDGYNKISYTDRFYRAPSLIERTGISMTLRTGSEVQNIDFKYADTVALQAKKLPERESDDEKKVAYFKSTGMLYVRVPEMNSEWKTYFPDTIKQIAKANPIKKVVIDIRGNGGGSDDVGLNIIKSLIADTIKTQVKILANNSDIIKSRDKLWDGAYEKVPYLGNKEYLVIANEAYNIVPDANSIRYPGNVYILQDENVFSAAGTLTAVAGYSSKVINVGSATGSQLGRGIDPLLFRLPNSKVMFRIEPVVDHSGATRAEDVFHDNVKIRRDLTVEEWVFRRDYRGDVYDAEFLLKYDPLIKLVLAHEN